MKRTSHLYHWPQLKAREAQAVDGVLHPSKLVGTQPVLVAQLVQHSVELGSLVA